MPEPVSVASRKKRRTGRPVAFQNPPQNLTDATGRTRQNFRPNDKPYDPILRVEAVEKPPRGGGQGGERGRQGKRLAGELRDLNRRLDRLGLACQAMWELAQPQMGLTEAMLREKMSEIDLRDSAADGRITRSVVKCPACGHASNSQRRHCIYCGAEITSPHAFG